MLTLPHTVDVHTRAAAHKIELLRIPSRFLVSAMLAGMWIGVGDVLMWSAGGQFFVQDNPATELVAGSVFAAALTIVVFAGSELATSAMMILPIGALRGAISWTEAGVALLAVFFSNMIGSFAFAWVMIQTGLLKTGAAHDFWASYLTAKIEHTPVELFWRGVMANVLVSGAVWAAARLKSEAGKAIIIFWCVLGFVASGFEHVVANMTTFAIGLLGGGNVDVTWGDFGINMFTVGLGNLVGGGIVIGIAYAFIAGRTNARSTEDVSVSR
ncbi:MAG TPA: formate/nitrite transporter family protein [Demequina sp.]|nr:formate/nitrite transporter family protein [Demequina sp.]